MEAHKISEVSNSLILVLFVILRLLIGEPMTVINWALRRLCAIVSCLREVCSSASRMRENTIIHSIVKI